MKKVSIIENYYKSILKIKDKSGMEMIIPVMKTLLHKQYTLELNVRNEGALFLSKAIYNDFKGNGEKSSKDKPDKNKTEFTRLLEKTITLDKAK